MEKQIHKEALKREITFEETWSVGLFEGDSPFNLKHVGNSPEPILRWQDVNDMPASFVADPFMIKTNDTWYMFVEIMNSENGIGVIGLATSQDGRVWNYEKVVLEEEYHLSYPYVFEQEGEFYMIPETLGANAIRLYKSTNFPFDWEYQSDLFVGEFSDPTVFEHEGKWWMFAGANPMQSNTLNLFYADSFKGPFVEHPQSPIIENDKRHARPAGRINTKQGLIRICQDCVPIYGSRIRAFEITELSITAYKEIEVAESPVLSESEEKGQWNSRGMHHMDAYQIDTNKWIACVDGCYSH